MAARKRKLQRRTGLRGSVRVRMYRVGFGDCFLVTFRGRRTHHVLVDCGVHTAGDIGTLERVVRNILAETDGRLALIIASHAHEDHIAGFARHDDLFRQLRSLGEIWLPWTENPRDRVAARLRRTRAAAYERLRTNFAARPPSDAAMHALANLAAARNQLALDNLRSGFGLGLEPRYLEAGEDVKEPGGIPGLTARLLGPPKDEAFLKKMDPPKAERFLRMSVEGPGAALLPFAGAGAEGRPAALSPDDERRLRSAAEGSLEGMAFALNEAMNNTSLVVLFTYRGVSLLFPGDAQFGNWKFWLDQDDAGDTLSGIRFYKVSHHGSENATPKSALERMTSTTLAAMVSTQSRPWPSIPYGKLMKQLEQRTGAAIVRSDSLPLEGAPRGPALERQPRGFRAGPFWYDYEVRV